MWTLVNRVRSYCDVDGAKLVPDGPRLRPKPRRLLLRRGPGFDHTRYKPAFSSLADAAQVVYLDHRGNGRSEHGPRERWTLAQWADDVRAFCETLGIERPVPEARDAARRYWEQPGGETLPENARLCFPLYGRAPRAFLAEAPACE